MAATTVPLHRKLTTYGKSSHKPLLNWNHIPGNVALESDPNLRHDEETSSKVRPQKLRPWEEVQSKDNRGQQINPDTRPSLRTGAYQSGADLNVTTDNHPLTLPSKFSRTHEDIPEDHSRHKDLDSQKRRFPKKRKRTASETIDNTVGSNLAGPFHASNSGAIRPPNSKSSIVSSDRPQLSPKSNDRSSSPLSKKSSRSNSNLSLGIKKNERVGNVNLKYQRANAGIVTAGFIGPSNSEEGIQPRSRGNIPADLTISTASETNSVDSTCPSPPRTPPGANTGVTGATTPHQRELWQMLLSDDMVKNNSSKTSLVNSNYDGSKPRHAQRLVGCRATDIAPNARKIAVSHYRRKLTHNLQHLDCHENDWHRPTTESILSDISSDLSLDSTEKPTTNLGLNETPEDTIQSRPGQQQMAMDAMHTFSHPRSPKRTYINQRSYVADDDLGEAMKLSITSLNDHHPMADNQDRRSGIKKTRAGALSISSASFDDLDSSQSTTMRTIHELRETGGNVRQLGDLEALLDDIDGQQGLPINLRRSQMLELVNRLQSSSYCRLFTDHGLEARLMASKWLKDDPILRALLGAALLCLVVAQSAQAFTSISDNRVVEFFGSLLDHHSDLVSLVQDNKLNMSKVARHEFQSICHTLTRSNIWRIAHPSKLSERLLGLQGLDHIVHFKRKSGYKAEVLSRRALLRVVEILPVSSLTDNSEEDGTETPLALALAVSVLESSTASDVGVSEELWPDEALEYVIKLLPKLNRWPETNLHATRMLAFRLVLNLTNNSLRICEAFARVDVVSSIFDTIHAHFLELLGAANGHNEPEFLDALILSLGSLINLVEWSGAVRRFLKDLRKENLTYLEILLELFQTSRSKIAEVWQMKLRKQNASDSLRQDYLEKSISFNVPFGYLSVLLCFMCVSGNARELLHYRFEDQVLRDLHDAAEEFLQYHRQIDEEALGSGEVDMNLDFIGRLQQVVETMKHVQHTTSDS
ncbi:MAG: hypothetical protein LQ342_000749 [Letrouitia transgressa]|nr:MAG: hypothetical protein LQ342_000749 [Letrouitia transgressa]